MWGINEGFSPGNCRMNGFEPRRRRHNSDAVRRVATFGASEEVDAGFPGLKRSCSFCLQVFTMLHPPQTSFGEGRTSEARFGEGRPHKSRENDPAVGPSPESSLEARSPTLPASPGGLSKSFLKNILKAARSLKAGAITWRRFATVEKAQLQKASARICHKPFPRLRFGL